ncbi:MAG: hypothetical protein ACOY93_01155 [Bacillota bacterium]
MPWWVGVLGLQLLAWAVGTLVTVVLLDSDTGLVRDHPPLAWRIGGLVPGPLAALSLVFLLLCGGPLWLCLAVVLPAALMLLAYSWAWARRYPAERRRVRGREALIISVTTVLFVSLEQSTATEGTALVMAAFAGSAALFGGLGTLLLGALVGSHGGDQVVVKMTPYGMPARVVATGLGVTLLALVDTLLFGGGAPVLALSLWATFSLLAPLSLVAAGHRLFPRWQSPIWASALGSVLVGQFALHAGIFLG